MARAVDSERTEVVAVDGFVFVATTVTVAVRTSLPEEELTAAVAVISAVAATVAVVRGLVLMIVVVAVASGVAEDSGKEFVVADA